MKIKSRVLSLALVLAMVMSAFSPALAKTGKQQDVKKKEIEKHALKAANAQKKGNTKKRNVFEEGDFKSSGAILTGFSDSGLEKFNTQSDKTVNLPETMGGVKITTIGNHAFSGLKISGLNIPEGYERINVRAFYKSDLKKIQVPKELKKIDKIAFEDSIAKVEVYTEDQACFDALKALIKKYDDEDEEAGEEPSCSWTVKLGQSNNNTVNLTFKANNGTNEIKTVKVEKDKEYILPECDFAAPAGKEFKSWDLGHGMFKKPGEKFTPKTDKEITAIWEKISGIENFTLDKTEINTMANEKLTAKFKVKDMATLSGHFDLVLRVQSYTTIQPGLKIKVKRTIGSDVKENTFTTVDKLTTSSLLCLAKAVGDDKLLSFEQNKGKEIEHEISFEGIPEDKTYKLKLQVCSFDNENFTSSVASAHYETGAIDFTAKSSIPEGKVSVNFDANGGTGSMQSEIIDKDSEYELPNCEFEPPAEKVFDKWSVSIGGSAPEGKNPGDKITTSGNVTVKAEWKDKPAPPTPKYKVTFDADGGEGEMPEAEVEENDDYILPACAFGAPEGKEFDKWSVTVGGAAPVDKIPGDSVKVTGNVTVKAVWKNKPIPMVNLLFKANNGTNETKTITVEKDKEYILPECEFAAPAGKEFKAWDIGHGMFKKPGEKFTPKTDKEITAIWAKISGIENFTLDKTEINTMVNEKLTAKFKVKDMATLSGNFDLVLRVQSYTTIQPGLKIKVKRTIGSDVKENTFTTVDKLTSSSLLCLAKAVGDDKLLSFEQNKGKEIEHEISFEGIPKDKSYKLKLQVCSFDGENFVSNVSNSHPEVDAIDFTAKSSVPEGKVSLNFDANGGKGNMPGELLNKDSEYKLPECGFTAPEGKEFDKWSVKVGAAQEVEKAPGDSITASADIIVKALWKDKPAPMPKKFKITFDKNGGSGDMAEVTAEEGDDYVLPASTFEAPEGMEFDKWEVKQGSENPSFKNAGDIIKVIDNVTVKAVWKNKPIPSVDVTFDADGGSGEMPNETVTKNSKYTLPSCEFTAPSGSEFLKWEVKVGAAAPVFKMPGDRIAASDSISVKAVWSKKITAKFNSGDEEINGKLPENIVVTGSKEIFLPLPVFAAVDETKEFVAWEDEEHNQYLPGAAFMLDENTEFTAVWKTKIPQIPVKTVKFNFKEGAEEHSYEVDTTITLPKYDMEKHPISEGMKFTGWKVEVAGEQAKMLEVGDSFELKDNTVITPEYEKIPPKPLTKLKIKAPKTFKIKKKAKKAVLTLNIKGAKQVDLKKLNAELRMGKKLIKKMDLKSIGKKGAYKIKLTAKDIKKLKKGKLSFIVIGNNSIAGIKVTINFAFK